MIVPVIGKPVELVPPGTPAGERQLVHCPVGRQLPKS
jgi:hypothetical protein